MRFTTILTGLTLLAQPALAEESLLQQGAEIYRDICHVCHDPDLSGADRIAPPIFAAVNHYSDLSEKDDFVTAVAGYITAPNANTTRMPGAINRFGLMPAQSLTEDEARAVAAYLFETDFTLPDWYLQHYQEEHGEAPQEN